MNWNSRVNLSMSSAALAEFARSPEVKVILQNTQGRTNSGPWDFMKMYAIGVQSEFSVSESHHIHELKDWITSAEDLIIGCIGYDVKNFLEDLKSDNSDAIHFPEAYFFVPKIVILEKENDVLVGYGHTGSLNLPTIDEKVEIRKKGRKTTISRNEYLKKAKSLLNHIQLGDIYEINFCVEHAIENIDIDPYQVFNKLSKHSPAPFSCLVSLDKKHLISASPERFIAKIGSKVFSQPMKGTNERLSKNKLQKEKLSEDPKERAENIMITDLVRNDLSKTAILGSVRVEELCGVYEFEHVNQMISTVSCEVDEHTHPLDILLSSFPMGSMTGAPKVSAMELIETHENFKRGMYSGSVGYITPDMDFDFNVVIRSILYNENTQLATFPTGSAITINSDPEKEFEECMLKAEAMRTVLMSDEN